MSHYENICSIERFSKDTATHEMTVIRDDGVYRHLRFKRPSSSAYYFDLVTWPCFLAITGDMGENMFSRTKDMFEFFRDGMNPSYWSEKILPNGCDSVKEWDSGLFNEAINKLLNNRLGDGDLDEENAEELKDNVNTFLLNPEDEHDAISKLREWNDENLYIELCDFPSNKVYTFHYVWRCRAIAWGIQQYDKFKAESLAATEIITESAPCATRPQQPVTT